MVESFSCSAFNKVLSIFETSSPFAKCECFYKLFSIADVTDSQLFSDDKQLFTINADTFSKSNLLAWVSSMGQRNK